MNVSIGALRWIDSYLTRRSQLTKVKGVEANVIDIGVLQGSNLRASTFHIVYYADDTAILVTGNNLMLFAIHSLKSGLRYQPG